MLGSKFTTPGEEEHQSLFAAYDWRSTDQRRWWWRTLIGAIPMVTKAQSVANWCNKQCTHNIDHTTSFTSTHHVVRSASSAPHVDSKVQCRHLYFQWRWGTLADDIGTFKIFLDRQIHQRVCPITENAVSSQHSPVMVSSKCNGHHFFPTNHRAKRVINPKMGG